MRPRRTTCACTAPGRAFAVACLGAWAVAWCPAGRCAEGDGAAASPFLLRTLSGHRALVRSVVFSPTEELLASGSQDRTVRLWDPQSGESVGVLESESIVMSLAFSPDGALLAGGCWDGNVRLWDLGTGEAEQTLDAGRGGPVRGVAFSPDGAAVAAGCEDQSLRVWEVETGKLKYRKIAAYTSLAGVAYSPAGTALVTVGREAGLRLWRPADGTNTRALKAHKDNVFGGLAFAPDGGILACAGADHTVRLWNARNWEPAGRLVHGDRILGIGFSADSKWLASAGVDSTVRVWNMTSRAVHVTLAGHTHPVQSVAFSPDGRLIASGGDDSTVRIWDAGASLAAEPEPEVPVPTIVEEGWRVTRTVRFAEPRAAHYNARDGLLYVARKRSPGTLGGGLYRINGDDSVTKLADGYRVTGVVVDPRDGDVFLAETVTGEIYYTAFGTTGRLTWASGFHAGDDDPVGIAIPPVDYAGTLVKPGEALFVDMGHNGPDEVWRFSTVDAADAPALVHRDDGTLVNAVDITIGTRNVYLVDTGIEEPGMVYELRAGGRLTKLPMAESLGKPCAIAVAPVTQDLLVVDSEAKLLLRIKPGSGAATVVAELPPQGESGEACLDITPDGREIILTDHGLGVIFVLTREPR